ncbi:MAG: helix-turn-helix transcriptional regulator [Lentisphaerae bacterium]|nr:helix-turn-helix transcriptional regulator [Lentisphaerota bacterium]
MTEWEDFINMKGKIIKMSDASFYTLRQIQEAFTGYCISKGEPPLELAYYLGALLCEIKKCDHSFPPGDGDAWEADSQARAVADVCRHIYTDYAGGIDLSEIAKSNSVSESHLRALFRRRMGIGIGGFLMNTRMSIAANLLKRSKVNIAEIASRCGFSGVYAFSRAFKKYHGISPMEFRHSKES